MPKFVLVDPCLRYVGGHNYQCACDVLCAAESMGHEPVVVSNQKFKQPSNWPEKWLLFREFHQKPRTRARYGLGSQGKSDVPFDFNGKPLVSGPWGGLVRLRHLWKERERKEAIEDFGAGCARVFSQIGDSSENIWFFPSFNEFDLIGLIRFLKDTPQTKSAAWNLQFHFPIIYGRVPEFESQGRRFDKNRRFFDHMLSHVPSHRLNFYATTKQVAEQYNRTGAVVFKAMPSPVNPRILEAKAERVQKVTQVDSPVRAALPGSMRSDKGRHGFTSLLDGLSRFLLDAGKVQLWLQASDRNLFRWISKPWLKRIEIQPSIMAEASKPVVLVRHPLSTQDYKQFICQADLGLFLYDTRIYYARCSGPMVEMLAVGIPVFVPAACWLSHEIQPENDQYLRGLVESSHVCDKQLPPASSTGGSDSVGFGDRTQPWYSVFRRPSEAVDVLVDMAYEIQNPKGHYVRIQVEQLGVNAQPMGRVRSVICGPSSDGRLAALFPLDDAAQSIRVELTNAYCQSSLKVRDPAALFLEGKNGGHHPRGVVGLVFNTVDDMPDLMEEFLAHRRHYQSTAMEFSEAWGHLHDPMRTVEELERSRCLDVGPSAAHGAQTG